MSNFKHPGYIYILTNDFLPGSVKIGYTSRSIKERINELSDTGMPSEYRPYFFEFVEDAPAVEEAIHCSLFDNRINMDREFFNIHPESAVDQFRFESKKYRDKLQDDLFNKKKASPSYLTKEYNNPKFGEFVNLLIKNKGKASIKFDDLAEKLDVNEKTLKSLIYVAESQPMKILYTQGYKGKHHSDLKYNLYLKFGENQLNELSKRYPKIKFDNFINKKEEFVFKTNKIKDDGFVEVELSNEEGAILIPMIKHLQTYSNKYNQVKASNENKPKEEQEKLPKRFFTSKELSDVLKVDEQNIVDLIKKCDEDTTLEKCIYHYTKINKYCLHGDFSNSVFELMQKEQPFFKNIKYNTVDVKKAKSPIKKRKRINKLS